ncbi:dTDP-4-amino-4,6-dideoxygalactose transaminase [Marinobacterium maritimum]|uniref:dTDP-4-amino-4,6-dideoxygalactose transaminase n=1 Tax=Marinobacterium maritimum TaxID=500162 RepID=A0ABP3TDS4_9GAMM
MVIDFNKPLVTGNEIKNVTEAIASGILSGDGPFSQKCHQWFKNELGFKKCFLTPSCTAALEIAALVLNIGPGDEVIMPSYTFVSTANAFVLRGAKVVFVDIRPDTMNIDESLIEFAITENTRAIVVVHYAGVACDMETVMDLATKYNLPVVEDAAQGMMSTYKGRPLGGIGHIGTFSFHETKNYTSAGEGGLLIINDDSLIERSEIIRQKGTNRTKFFKGLVDKYSWVDIGSSYLLSEIQAAYLFGQLEVATEVNAERLAIWERYNNLLMNTDSFKSGRIQLASIPLGCQHNGHLFQVKVKNVDERDELIRHLKDAGISAPFHYVPLHTSLAGKEHGVFSGVDRYTSTESERLLRLPLWYGLSVVEQEYVTDSIEKFFKG